MFIKCQGFTNSLHRKSEMPDIEQPLIANYELAVRMLGFSATELSKSISASPPFLAIKIYP